jgi:hypothetical protein
VEQERKKERGKHLLYGAKKFDTSGAIALNFFLFPTLFYFLFHCVSFVFLSFFYPMGTSGSFPGGKAAGA